MTPDPAPPAPRAVLQPPDPRDAAVEAAAAELRAFIHTWVEAHRVTSLEYLYILGVLSTRQVQSMCIHERQVLNGPGVAP